MESGTHLDVVVVGSGLMGRGIAQVFATAGNKVALVDVSEEILAQATSKISSTLTSLSKEGLFEESPIMIMSRITPYVDVKVPSSRASFVVEAISENLDLKKEVFKILDENTTSECILATNTAGLRISEIAKATRRPERVVGTHFWNPPHLVPAVEVVRGEMTTDETVDRTVKILRSVGKTPAVVKKDVPGQIGVRILYAMIREATWLVENGVASPQEIDTVVKEALGTRLEVLGPFELADLAGVDMMYSVAQRVYASLDDSKSPQKLVADMVASGQVGAKAGKGFYDWIGGTKSLENTISSRDQHLIRILKERKLNKNLVQKLE